MRIETDHYVTVTNAATLALSGSGQPGTAARPRLTSDTLQAWRADSRAR